MNVVHISFQCFSGSMYNLYFFYEWKSILNRIYDCQSTDLGNLIISLHFPGGSGDGNVTSVQHLTSFVPGCSSKESRIRWLGPRFCVVISFSVWPPSDLAVLSSQDTQGAAEPLLDLPADPPGPPPFQLCLGSSWVVLSCKKLSEIAHRALLIAYHFQTHRSIHQGLGHAPWFPKALLAHMLFWAISFPAFTTSPTGPGKKMQAPLSQSSINVCVLMIFPLRLPPPPSIWRTLNI